MWVAVCEREIAARRCTSTSARTGPQPTDHLTDDHARLVHDQPGERGLHVVHRDPRAGGRDDDAVVGELSTTLGVEGGAIEHDLDLIAFGRRGHRSTGRDQAEHGRLRDDLGVAGEGDRRPRAAATLR